VATGEAAIAGAWLQIMVVYEGNGMEQLAVAAATLELQGLERLFIHRLE
jgi:hypothetical protein